ncbi:hypothetical protein F441_10044 [Phytophthora nicotianae CJ01A1]|uniref:Tc1-like transposase DDE domain-containing protein n=3 Tax=Phytophthora nicotianae TaxID=4792 RepID=W2R7N0_PHYN3|nr:hypothetical protein PPTG_01582 [Phytophthora nicotianae INRA-310]ETM45098.1 hypothetical protein L914_09771 [Phytophthora nicotianae]ETN21392.1 hypothetical protein PPTG_01582 [Phytophthora nicotianae INRA-310]ETP15076.1 hypothetical protein F441_10044 [Phytophthora nicotianae CJ01A1]
MEVRQDVRAAAASDQFAAELKANHGIKASMRTVQRLLQRVDHLVYTKMDGTLLPTAAHKTAAMGWAEEHIFDPGKQPRFILVYFEILFKHASSETMRFLQEMEVNTMAWPARTPDYNLIENVWSGMAARVSAHGLQYHITGKIEEAIR